MMRKTKTPPAVAVMRCGGEEEKAEWEVRPGGMLVQKRSPSSEAAVAAAAVAPAATVRVKVKYGSAYHEIYISSQATFGELKKKMSEKTGLHPQDQKVVFKDKERDSTAFLDISGVKDGSKMAIMEDPAAQAKRLLEARRKAKTEKAAKCIAAVGHEVDRLAAKVMALDAIVSKGGKVVESDVVNLIELLMAQLIKLDGVVADGDAKLQRGMQVRRVQKYVETLDVIKIKNAMPRSNGQAQTHSQQSRHQPQQPTTRQQKSPPVVVTTKWETFDSMFTPSPSSAASATPSTTTTTTTTSVAPTPRFEWELF